MTNAGDRDNPKPAESEKAKPARRRVMIEGDQEGGPKRQAVRSVREILGADREPTAADAELPPNVSPWDPARLEAFLRGQITLGDLEGITKQEQYEMAKIGYSYLSSGKLTQAKTVFEGLLALDPFDAYFHMSLGSIAQQANDFVEAEKRYTRALEINPFSPIAFANRGEVRVLSGHLAEGTADLVKALQEDPQGQYPSTLRARATINVLREQLQAASGGAPLDAQPTQTAQPAAVKAPPAAKPAPAQPGPAAQPAAKAPAKPASAAPAAAKPAAAPRATTRGPRPGATRPTKKK